MVGRDLPNLCPHGEDHLARRGARGGGGGSKSRRQDGSRRRRRECASRSLIAMIQIRKALG
jgi:hypothetical protein